MSQEKKCVRIKKPLFEEKANPAKSLKMEPQGDGFPKPPSGGAKALFVGDQVFYYEKVRDE